MLTENLIFTITINKNIITLVRKNKHKTKQKTAYAGFLLSNNFLFPTSLLRGFCGRCAHEGSGDHYSHLLVLLVKTDSDDKFYVILFYMVLFIYYLFLFLLLSYYNN